MPRLLGTAAVALATLAFAAVVLGVRSTSDGVASFAAASSSPDVLPRLSHAVLRETDWWGGVYRTAAGETVRVYVSDFYPQDEQQARRWVDYLASLVHGREISDLTLYVAPEGVVVRMCGEGALGCYGYEDASIIVIGDEVELPDPLTVEQVLAHEYGHHVANSRSNAPWDAVMWGTKRWASVVGVCERVRAGTAGDRYDRDPGEGFAETYRRLTEMARGTPFVWPIVDDSFRPNARRLESARLDVVTPWSPTRLRLAGRLAAPGRTVRRGLATPLDGTLVVRLVAPRDARLVVSIVDPENGRVLAHGAKRVSTTVCGLRRHLLVVRTAAGSGRYALFVTRP